MEEIHDIEICKECHYMKIKDYSCRERHCRKCNNYGKECLEADVRIIQKPVSARVDCPHCYYEIDMDYKEFESAMPNDYPGDWAETVIECPNCDKKIEIADNEWD